MIASTLASLLAIIAALAVACPLLGRYIAAVYIDVDDRSSRSPFPSVRLGVRH